MLGRMRKGSRQREELGLGDCDKIGMQGGSLGQLGVTVRCGMAYPRVFP